MLEVRKILVVATMAAAVAGCQSSPWHGRFMAKANASPSLRGSETGAQQLEEGRQYLREGNLSRAVASFQLARLDSDSAAEANNGLAVVYAKLGRPDLAERYFRTAILLKPDDTRYVANLLRLQGRVLMARQRTATARLASATAAPVARPSAASVRVHRVSAGEFRIQTAEPERAPTMKIEYRQAAVVQPIPAEEASAPSLPEIELASAHSSRPFEVVFAPWLQK
ncbi:tetratricopeptide repeat protein [Erythrobacter mangrovi]|uniref:Tetratricopeptide repeat protein n=1 Tax=Erythrobacter mangrovi TaxID=2739433 RepID=A0A7D3XH82_9SPHN|nr:tetratricopeptide repeat protein [Erythrobacter mangrovi]QKG71133.1 tetratricopeptide repeat protein [Erythrobacter mangrovi]